MQYRKQKEDAMFMLASKVVQRIDNDVAGLTLIVGDPGTGKSTFAIELAHMIDLITDVDWDWGNNIFYSGEEFIKAIQTEGERYRLKLMNEGMEDYLNIEFMTDIARETRKVSGRQRAFGIPYLIIIPFSSMNLLKGLRGSADFKVQTYLRRSYRKARIWEGERQVAPNPKHTEPYWRTLCHEYTFPPLPPNLAKAYKKYDIGIKDELGKRKTKDWVQEITDRINEGANITSGDDVYIEFKEYGLTAREAMKYWKDYKHNK